MDRAVAPAPRQLAERLAGWHGHAGELVRRSGRAYPVTIEHAAVPQPEKAVVVHDRSAEPDARLAGAGEQHHRTVASRSPGLHDGPVLVMERVEAGVLHVVRSGYFAMVRTCDALAAELDRAGDSAQTLSDLTMRAMADGLADHRPLHSGRGRAAAVGVSAVVTFLDGGGRSLVTGLRRRELATDPGRWHVAPSGMLEPDSSEGNAVRATVARELAEELGLGLKGAARLTVLGLAHDLRRLRPEVCLHLDLPYELKLPAETDEFECFEAVPLADTGRFWERRPPDLLTPAAAGAVALLEAGVGVRD